MKGYIWYELFGNESFTYFKTLFRLLYCLNDYISVERYQIQPDLVFIMDQLDEKPQIVSGHDNLGTVIEKINKLKVPLISPYRYEEIPLFVPFPLKKCVEEFGMPYFTNTICYMIAYAILAGAREIELYGVNQASSHEYSEERGGVEYWLGVASGRGIKVAIHGDKSEVLRFKGRYGKGILYGYLTNLETIQRDEKRYGERVIKRLFKKPQPYKRTIRKLNS